MLIYLMRHGETTGDVEDRYGGDYDDHLTSRGVEESQKAVEKLKGNGIVLVYSSPKIRARETAERLSRSIGAELVIIPDLAERNHYGVLTGMIKSEALRIHPSHVTELKRGLRHNVEGSEKYQAFRKRVIVGFNEATNGKANTIAIVTHGGVIKCIVREILKKGEMGAIEDCAILTISKKGEALSLIGMDGAKLEN